ncbi:MAG: hypothetical protein EP349_09780 [Alphaproteobacteria bacterium]|nr:MAG: hypothetical protein EP349_09780 [Alphaproteobacteria bacterium]
MMDEDKLNALSPAVRALADKIEETRKAADVLQIMRTDFTALTTEEQEEMAKDYFMAEMDIDNPEFIAMLSAQFSSLQQMQLLEMEDEEDIVIGNYVLAEVFSIIAKTDCTSPLIPAMEKYIGALTDEEYRRPEALSLALQQAFQEALGNTSDNDDKQSAFVPGDLKNPFRAAAEKAAQENKPPSVPSHASLRSYLGKKK